ncbi:IQ domain-containing protein IQM2-like [Hordeum vulgare]|nr:IQ domain-containing protein IQM2-like [Hordeum vulgare]
MSSSSSHQPLLSGGVPEKLSRTNYVLWRTQLTPQLRGAGVYHYIDGTTPEPATVLSTKDTAGKESSEPNPLHPTWVGKGLSKDDKAQKLALQHWLEAIDPHHRYGHNLHYYYDCWLHSESKQPFFYWLDVGEGKDINLEGKCSRSKLLSQCIKYLDPKEREDYEVVIEDSKFMYRKSRQIIDTSFGPRDAKWIFVLSTSKSLYVGQKKKGKFQHSSFLAWGATSAAGRLVAENGTLKAIWPHNGHYRPTEENFEEFKSFLKDNLVDLTDMSRAKEDEEFWGSLKRITSENDKYEDDPVAPEETGPLQKAQLVQTTSTESEKREESAVATTGSLEDAKATEASTSSHMSENDLQRGEQAWVPRKKILQRINSKKDMKSYQLGKQLSFKWSTGAGPRIGCVRDYPSELQAHALEQMNLSPRCATGSVCTRFASPLRRSFNSIVTRGCENETSTSRGEFRSSSHASWTACRSSIPASLVSGRRRAHPLLSRRGDGDEQEEEEEQRSGSAVGHGCRRRRPSPPVAAAPSAHAPATPVGADLASAASSARKDLAINSTTSSSHASWTACRSSIPTSPVSGRRRARPLLSRRGDGDEQEEEEEQRGGSAGQPVCDGCGSRWSGGGHWP